MRKELMEKLKQKEKKKSTECGNGVWVREYRNVVRTCRDATRKTKAHWKLNLVKEVKDNNKGSLKCVNSRRMTGENAGLLLRWVPL